ncbi:MAG: LptF/LptG family permease [Phycisphaerales bacterium]|nr:LptF/LptG family permease [Phycisphaerales bacterium]
MARPQPITLWTSIFWELTRTVVITAAVLVSVIAFAATIKPLADGRLGPLEAIKYTLLAIPPMLAYALPFAGCFASSLVYYRLSTDNEFVAAASGGVSHRSLLLPAAALGLVLFVGMTALSDQVIPRFLQTMRLMITEDIAKLLATNINRGQSVDLKKYLVFADRAQRIDVDPASGASSAVVLARPAVLERDPSGVVVSEGTASRATIWLFPQPSQGDSGPTTRLAMRFEDFVSKDAKTGLVTGRTLPVSLTVPATLADDPKFLRSDELRDLNNRPERMGWIDQRRRQLATEIARERVIEEFTRSLSLTGSFTLLDSAGRQVVVSGRSIQNGPGRAWTIVPKGEFATVDVLRGSEFGGGAGAGVRHSAKSVVLAPDFSEEVAASGMSLRLELRDAGSAPLGSDRSDTTKRERLSIGALRAPQSQADQLLKMTSLELLGEGDKMQSSSTIKVVTSELRRELEDLSREVMGKQNDRVALSVSCLVMLLTGAVTALRFSKSLPLTVYLWSFFPALLCVITIAGGQQLTHAHGWPGLGLLWGGVLLLAGYTFLMYATVRRH